VIDQALRVRRAGRRDAPAIASVLRAAFAEYESLYTRAAFAATTPAAEEIARRLGDGQTWIALLHRTVVGTVSAVSRGEALYVRSMAVVPEAQGRGVGRRLLAHVERYAGERGFLHLELSTTPFLASAIALYERAGFSRCDGEPRELCGTQLLNMRKALVLRPQEQSSTTQGR
jgi:GNAT superfamily N-acetyltransferase